MKKLIFTITTMFALGGFATSAVAEDPKANAVAGEKKAAMCIGCHGIHRYQASFPEVYKVPMIAGQASKYIVSALSAYKKGDRKHPTMVAIAGGLSDQDMADLAAFYEQLPKAMAATANVGTTVAQPSPQVADVLTKGNCVSCHGNNFSKPLDGNPKLAGQYADYLYAALKAYQTTGNAVVGRANPVMSGLVAPYSPAQLKAVAEYLATLPSELYTVPQPRFR